MNLRKMIITGLAGASILGMLAVNNPSVFADDNATSTTAVEEEKAPTTKEELKALLDKYEEQAVEAINKTNASPEVKAEKIKEYKELLGKESILQYFDELMASSKEMTVEKAMESLLSELANASTEPEKGHENDPVGEKKEFDKNYTAKLDKEVKEIIAKEDEKHNNRSEEEKVADKVADLKNRDEKLTKQANEFKEKTDKLAEKLAKLDAQIKEEEAKEVKDDAKISELKLEKENTETEFHEAYSALEEVVDELNNIRDEYNDSVEELTRLKEKNNSKGNMPNIPYVPAHSNGVGSKEEKVVVKEGWQLVNSKWYFYKAGNQVKSEWKKTNGKWYFLNETGAMATGWVKDNGTWYFLNETGAMETGWVQVKGTWYFLNKSGAMQTGWLQNNGTWYFLEDSGAMKASQWFEVGGKWYYVDGTGALAVNTTVDGYTVNENGEWV